jgi:formate-dependent nitrite reductase membrane component NrfD
VSADRAPGRRRGDAAAVVPPVEARTYYDDPVIRPPVWKQEIAWYFFAGGLAGASSTVALAARLTGRPALARVARLAALGGVAVSPPLLVADLGVPSRFANMLRVFKPSSPMSMGSWLLAGYIPSAAVAGGLEVLDRLPAVRLAADVAAGALGPAMTTYTAVLVTDTAVPVWHEARRHLPFVFAASALAAAGGVAVAGLAAMAATAGASGGRGSDAAVARRLAVAAALAEAATAVVMERSLGDVGRPYHTGRAGRFAVAARASGLAGAVTLVAAPRQRAGRVLGGTLVAAASAGERFAVLHAGRQSALDPRVTTTVQHRDPDRRPASRRRARRP